MSLLKDHTGVQISSSFDLHSLQPIDSRFIVNTIEDLNYLSTSNAAYEGLIVFVKNNHKFYKYVNNLWMDNDNYLILDFDNKVTNVTIFDDIQKILDANNIPRVYIKYNSSIIPASYTNTVIKTIYNTSNKTTLLAYDTDYHIFEYDTKFTTSVNVKDGIIEFKNADSTILYNLALSDLGLKFKYDDLTGDLTLVDSTSKILTSIDINDKIIKSAVFDTTTEELILTFFGETEDESGNKIPIVTKIPLSSISDKIKYYYGDDILSTEADPKTSYIVLKTETNPADNKKDLNIFTLSDYVKNILDAIVPKCVSDLASEIDRATKAENDLQTNINTVAQNLATETTNRTNADTALRTSIDSINIEHTDDKVNLKYDSKNINIFTLDTTQFDTIANKKLTLSKTFVDTFAKQADLNATNTQVTTNKNDIKALNDKRIQYYSKPLSNLLTDLQNKTISIGTYILDTETLSTIPNVTNEMAKLFTVYEDNGVYKVKCHDGILLQDGTFVKDNYFRITGGTITGPVVMDNTLTTKKTSTFDATGLLIDYGDSRDIKDIKAKTISNNILFTKDLMLPSTDNGTTYESLNISKWQYNETTKNYTLNPIYEFKNEKLYIKGDKVMTASEAYKLPNASYTTIGGTKYDPDDIILRLDTSTGLVKSDMSNYYTKQESDNSYIHNNGDNADYIIFDKYAKTGNVYNGIFKDNIVSGFDILTINTGLLFKDDLDFNVNLIGYVNSMSLPINLQIYAHVRNTEFVNPIYDSSSFKPDVYIYHSITDSNDTVKIAIRMIDRSLSGFNFTVNVISNQNILTDIWSDSTTSIIPNVDNVNCMKCTYKTNLYSLNINTYTYDGSKQLTLDLVETSYLEANYYSASDLDNMHLVSESTLKNYVNKSGDKMSGALRTEAYLDANLYVKTQTILNQDNNTTYYNRIDLGNSTTAMGLYTSNGEFNVLKSNDGSNTNVLLLLHADNTGIYHNGVKLISNDDLVNSTSNTVIYDDLSKQYKISDEYKNYVDIAVNTISDVIYNDVQSKLFIEAKYDVTTNNNTKIIHINNRFNNKHFEINTNDDNESYLNIHSDILNKVNNISDLSNKLVNLDNSSLNIQKHIISNTSGNNSLGLNLLHKDSSLDTILRLLDFGNYLTYNDTEINVNTTELDKLYATINDKNLINMELTKLFSSANIVDGKIQFYNTSNAIIGEILVKDLGLNISVNSDKLTLTDAIGNVLSEDSIHLDTIIKSASFDDTTNEIVLKFANDDIVKIDMESFTKAFPIYTGSDSITITSQEINSKIYNVINLSDEYKNKINNSISKDTLIDYLKTEDANANYYNKNNILDIKNKIQFFTKDALKGSIEANGSGLLITSDQIDFVLDKDNNKYNFHIDRNGITPNEPNEYSLGSVTNTFKNIYTENINNINTNELLLKSEIKNYVDLTSKQTVSHKTFTSLAIDLDNITPKEINLNGAKYNVNEHTKSNYYTDDIIISGIVHASNINGINGLKNSDIALNPNTEYKILLNSITRGEYTKTGPISLYDNQAVSGKDIKSIYDYINTNKQDIIDKYIKSVSVIGIDMSILDSSGQTIKYQLNKATPTELGLVMVGDTLSVDALGELNVNNTVLEYLIYGNKKNTFTETQIFNRATATRVSATELYENGTNINNIYAKKNEIADIYIPRGSVANFEALPTTDNKVGDVYTCLDTGTSYVWTFKYEWSGLGNLINMSNYLTSDIIENLYLSKLDADANFVKKEMLNDYYNKSNIDIKFSTKENTPTGIEYVYDEANRGLSFELVYPVIS